MLRTLGLLAASAVLAPASAAPAVAARPETSRADVLHRVVWDQYEKKGTHLWSANPDGSDARPVYVRPLGAPYGISLNRQGTEGAVAPLVLSATRSALIRFDVMGEGESQNLIADHPEIYYVGAIGWSPNGRKLAFEGGVEVRPDVRRVLLYTVHRDGTHLRRIVSLGDPRRNETLNEKLAWVPEGILFTDSWGLELLSHRHVERVLGGVQSLAISGDAGWLYVRRWKHGHNELWRLHPDGSGVERLFAYPDPGSGFLLDFQPSYDGSELLSWVEGTQATNFQDTAVVHDPTRPPQPGDQVLPITHLGAVSWN